MRIRLAVVRLKKGKNFAPIHAGIRVYRDAAPAVMQAVRGKLPKEPRQIRRLEATRYSAKENNFMDPNPDVLPHRLLDRDSGQMLMPLTPVIQFVEGQWRFPAGNPKRRLKCCHRCPAAIEAKDVPESPRHKHFWPQTKNRLLSSPRTREEPSLLPSPAAVYL